jgi:hypothetical protein
VATWPVWLGLALALAGGIATAGRIAPWAIAPSDASPQGESSPRTV